MLEHGGNLRAAAVQFGRDLSEWLDLSSGLNPHWYPAPAMAPNAWHRLPETDPALARAAAKYYGAPLVLSVAGSQAAIQALPQLRAPSRVVVAAPSYAEHAHHWARHGHVMREISYADLESAVPECDVMVLCNPNNPTGEFIAPERLLQWAAQLGQRGGWLVVDEAFADTAPEISVAAHSHLPGLIVLRSLGKFFGLAGVRVGFVAAQAELLSALADALGPWTVSGPAQQVSHAALCDTAWQAGTRARLACEGARLKQLLKQFGMASSGSPLYQWWPEADPEAFHEHMAKRGIWVRLFAERARGIRIGLPPGNAGWTRLEIALHEWKT